MYEGTERSGGSVTPHKVRVIPQEEGDVVARVGVPGVDAEGDLEVPLGLRPVLHHRRQVVVRQRVERPQPE